MGLPGQGILYEKLKELWEKYKSKKEEAEGKKEEKTLVTQPEWKKLDKEKKEIQSMDRENLEELTMNSLSTLKDMKKSQSNLQSRLKQLESKKKEEKEREKHEEIIEEKLEEAEERQRERTEQIKELRVHDQKLGMRELPKWLLASDHELPNYKYFYGWREEEKDDGEVKKIPLVTDDRYGKEEPRTLRNVEVDDEEEIFESKAGIIGQYKSGLIHTLIALDPEGEPLLLGQGVSNNGGKQRKQRSQGNNGTNDHIVDVSELQSNQVSQNQNRMGQQMSNREMQLQKAIQQLKQQRDKYKEEYQKANQREQQLQEQLETTKMQLKNTDEQRQHWAGAAAEIFDKQTSSVKEVAKVMGSLQDQVLNRLLAQGQAKTLSNALEDMKENMEEMLPEEKHDLVRKKVIDEINELQGGEEGAGIDPAAIKSAVKQGYQEAFQEVMATQGGGGGGGAG